jgi:hypothetical protein
MNLKTCTGCDEELPPDSFNKDAEKKDGLQTQCRPCKRKAQRKDYHKKKDVYADRRRAAYKKAPEKKSAHEAVRRAIKKGVLTRPTSCTQCGNSKMRIEAHHHLGYAREHQLDVVFLCTSCHRASEDPIIPIRKDLEWDMIDIIHTFLIEQAGKFHNHIESFDSHVTSQQITDTLWEMMEDRL